VEKIDPSPAGAAAAEFEATWPRTEEHGRCSCPWGPEYFTRPEFPDEACHHCGGG